MEWVAESRTIVELVSGCEQSAEVVYFHLYRNSLLPLKFWIDQFTTHLVCLYIIERNYCPSRP